MDWPAEKERIAGDMRACTTLQHLRDVWAAEQEAIATLREADTALGAQIINLKDYLKTNLIDDPARQAP